MHRNRIITAAIATATGASIVLAAGLANAAPAPHKASKGAERSSEARSTEKGKSAEKRKNTQQVTATGSVVSATATTVTVAVKGGSRELQRTTVTFTAGPDTRIKRSGETVADLSSFVAKDHIVVKGTKKGDTITVVRVNGGPEVEDAHETPESPAPTT